MSMPTDRLYAALLCALLAVSPALLRAAHHEDAEPTVTVAEPLAVVEGLQSTLLDYMRAAMGDTPPTDAAVASLDAAVLASHDFAYIARIVLGRTWRELEAEERQHFIDRFTALSLATYASRFADFSGEAFTVLDQGEGSFGQRKVSAELRTAQKRHSFDYLLRQGDGEWRIVNIVVDGVSDLALKRAEYSTLIADVGFDGLLEELDRQRSALGDASTSG